MITLRRLTSRLRRLAQDEAGFVLPTALYATVVGFALVSAALFASVATQQGSVRDQGSKSAIAAADAGASIATYRFNKLESLLSTQLPCLALNAQGVYVAVGTDPTLPGWCAATGGALGGGATYSYRTTPFTLTGPVTVVSTGCSSTTCTSTSSVAVSRRIAVQIKGVNIGDVLTNEGAIGQNSITLNNGSDIRLNIGTNGDVNLNNSANICGNIRVGTGHTVNASGNSSQCSGYTRKSGNVTLPPVPYPTDLATHNDDYRLAKCISTGNPAGCELDPFSTTRTSTVPWNPTTRVLSVPKNSTLTLGGGDYFICKLVLNGATLWMAQGSHVRVFFDKPQNCAGAGLASGGTQIDVSNSSSIQATGYQPGLAQFDVPGFYLLGDPNIPTSVSFTQNPNTKNELVIYAPNSDIYLANHTTFVGAIAGKTLTLDNNVVIQQDAGFTPPIIGGTTVFQQQRYVECAASASTGTVPNANC